MTTTRRVLIVDDDPHIRRLLRLYLRSQPFEIHEAGTGEEALAVFGQHKFDLVLLDLVLPYHGGFRLCQKFKASLHPPRVIIMTGDDTDEAKSSAKEWGADDFLAKPFDVAEVVKRIAALFGDGVSPSA